MIAKFFKLNELGSDIKTEILAGFTTFVTMSYILIINPKILEAAGMPFDASLAATIYSAFVGCLLMGLYAKRPFAVAPYMGENAFIAYTVVLFLGFSWQAALGAIFLSGLLFFILTFFNVRPWLVNSMPESLKLSFGAGLGLFLAFLGLLQAGIVVIGDKNVPVHLGNLHNPRVLLAVFGFFLITVLMAKKVRAAIFLGILTVTVLSFVLGLNQLPASIFSSPPSIMPVLGQLDIMGALKIGFLPIIFIIFVMVYVDTMGTLIGVSYRAGFLDEKGNLPEIHKPMFCDALATMFAALCGTTTSGVYLESATGIESGGKSGLTAVVVGCLFLLGLFFAPLFTSVPPQAYSPALIVVGILMISSIAKVNFDDTTEYVPACVTIIMMVFSYNIGIGMAAGFIVYPLMKLLSQRNSENNAATWLLCAISVVFFIFYPYK